MTTSKPISTISYNTEKFLQSKLNELVEKRIIEYAFYILHYAEEGEKKNHFHIYMQPTKKIDTIELRNYFKEIDFNNPKPLGCLLIEKSKFDDWYLYGLHDEVYLASKGKVKKYHYNKEDMYSTDDEILDYLVSEIKPNNKYLEMISFQKKGFTYEQYAVMKNIPFMQYNATESVWYKINEFSTNKKGEEHQQHLIDDYSSPLEKPL